MANTGRRLVPLEKEALVVFLRQEVLAIRLLAGSISQAFHKAAEVSVSSSRIYLVMVVIIGQVLRGDRLILRLR